MQIISKPSNGSWWSSATSLKVWYDAADTTGGYLSVRTVAGAGITLAEWVGADENKLVITNSAPDVVVAITDSGIATVTGTYPNFNVDVPNLFDWIIDPVDDWRDPTSGLPVAPSDGDRYVADWSWTGWTDWYIYEWDSTTSTWIETPPVLEMIFWMIAEMIWYVFGSGGRFAEGYGTYIPLDQTVPSLFTAGTVTGTGLLKVTAWILWLDTTAYLTSLSGALLATWATTWATLQAQVFTNWVWISTTGYLYWWALTTEWLTLRANNADTTTGAIAITTSTSSSSTTTGALTVAGGIGVAGTIWMGTGKATTYLQTVKTSTTTTPYTGFYLSAGTTASSGTPVRVAPDLLFTGYAWNTTPTAASNSINFRNRLLPVTGTTTSGSLIWDYDNNGGGYANIMSLNSTWTLNLPINIASTSTTTWALTVAWWVGIVWDVHFWWTLHMTAWGIVIDGYNDVNAYQWAFTVAQINSIYPQSDVDFILSTRSGVGTKSIIFKTVSTTPTEAWRINADGHFVWVATSTIGLTGTRVLAWFFTDLTVTNAIAWWVTGNAWTVTNGVYLSTTQTLTNKRITFRTWTTTSSATPTINTDDVDFYSLTAQAGDITSFTTNLSGTPTERQTLWIAITGTAARAITWGTSFEASTVALPTTTVTTARLDVWFIWNTVTSKWRCVAAA